MPSPFPGMDPYLEQSDVWHDFHQEWMTRARAFLASRVGPNYLVKIEVQLTLPAVDADSESWLEIRDRFDRRLITVIELLSPSNKTPGADRDAYLGKRRRVLASMAHLVEIDLRRGGERPHLPELPPCDYYALVSRYVDRPKLGLWPIALRERLPTIPVPLASPDADVMLDLQALLDAAYDEADYGKYIYASSPRPPLSPDDAEWAKQFLPQRGS